MKQTTMQLTKDIFIKLICTNCLFNITWKFETFPKDIPFLMIETISAALLADFYNNFKPFLHSFPYSISFCGSDRWQQLTIPIHVHIRLSSEKRLLYLIIELFFHSFSVICILYIINLTCPLLVATFCLSCSKKKGKSTKKRHKIILIPHI